MWKNKKKIFFFFFFTHPPIFKETGENENEKNDRIDRKLSSRILILAFFGERARGGERKGER